MIEKISESNIKHYYELCQPYEDEFSPLTGAKKDECGLYPVSTEADENHPGFLIYSDNQPVGFVVVNIGAEPFDVCELFVLKSHRGKGLAKKLAFEAFNSYKGEWTVKQLYNANEARSFWHKVIKEYTNNNFSEAIYQDKKWGKVYRQRFLSI